VLRTPTILPNIRISWDYHYIAHKQKKLRTIFQHATSYYTTRFLLSQSAFSTI